MCALTINNKSTNWFFFARIFWVVFAIVRRCLPSSFLFLAREKFYMRQLFWPATGQLRRNQKGPNLRDYLADRNIDTMTEAVQATGATCGHFVIYLRIGRRQIKRLSGAHLLRQT